MINITSKPTSVSSYYIVYLFIIEISYNTAIISATIIISTNEKGYTAA